MITNGYIAAGGEMYMSEAQIIHDTPIGFIISHQDRGNTSLEAELLQILSTIRFSDKSATNQTFTDSNY